MLNTMKSSEEPMAKKPKPSLTDQLRAAIDQSGLTRYRIAQETGMSEASLCQFYSGKRGLSMENLNSLAECLQITIHVGRKAEAEGK